MAEDQGINGDKWTEEASALLKRLGWQKVADSNIDIEGIDGYKHGIDALFKYLDGFSREQQGVFLEAKRYLTTSFSGTKLHDWVDKLNQKILQLRRSEEFNHNYPAMAETNPQNGLLVIWFSDVENYREFEPKFKKALSTVHVPHSWRSVCNRLFIFTNDDILRLCSLTHAINELNNRFVGDGKEQKLTFYYPSSVSHRFLSQFSSVINIEYMFSKFLMAKSKSISLGISKIAYLVFYFGNLDIKSFICLRSALLENNFPPDDDVELFIYCYRRDDEFRKIQPDVEAIFHDIGNLDIIFRTMDKYSDLPGWMKDS